MERIIEKVKKSLEALKKLPGRRRAGSQASRPEKGKLPGATRRKYIAWGCAGALVMLLAVMPMAASRSSADEPQASIVSEQAQLRELESKVLGGGQLSGEAAVSVTVPEGVKIEEYLVKNGDSVKEGQAVARVDSVSVMSAIASVQESLDYLSEEINSLSGEADTQTVSSGAAGQVKQVYAQAGDSVSELMLDKGALAVLSLDGLMAVQTETDSDLRPGEKVLVSFSDGSQVEGSVKSNVEGKLTVTVEDEDYEPGAEVSLSTQDGKSLGSSGRVPCVPVAALGKEGSQDVVYTGCDKDSGSLTDPVAVTTGVSDGEYVQLLSGLEEGREVYYAWYDGGSSSGMPDMEPPFER